MKFLLLFIPLLFIQASLSGQSYWFNGLTRLPASDGEGTTANVYFNYQSHSIDLVRATQLSTNTVFSGEPIRAIEFSGFAVGVEGAWEKKFFALEGGVDLGITGTDSDIYDIDDNYLGVAAKIGPMFKYEFKVNDDLSIIPFFRAGFLLEMATNDLALLAYSMPTTSAYYNDYNYIPLGSTFFNVFANYSIGSSVVWNAWTAGLELGKYQVIGGDLDLEGVEMPDPLFLRLSFGRKFSSGTLLAGYRIEFWDTMEYYSNPTYGAMRGEVEWSGHAFDISYQGAF
jgi:hypothetical protein